MAELPAGTITLLFADIERSTALLQQLGPERYGAALGEYRRLLRDAVATREGVEVGTEGDGFFAAFPSARDALAAATAAQTDLARSALNVRMGLHTGEPLVVDGYYSGIDVHLAARIAAAGHGGQVLLSQTTLELLEDAVVVRSLAATA
jgi:class 3 adenylate cyclase